MKTDKQKAESEGFTVDTTCSPWIAYKGPRFQPTESKTIRTDEECKAIKTDVLFRRYKKSPCSVVAIFPYELGTNDASTCAVYEAIGQHGAGDARTMLKITRPPNANDQGVEELRNELERIGYDLNVLGYWPNNARQYRAEQLRQKYQSKTGG